MLLHFRLCESTHPFENEPCAGFACLNSLKDIYFRSASFANDWWAYFGLHVIRGRYLCSLKGHIRHYLTINRRYLITLYGLFLYYSIVVIYHLSNRNNPRSRQISSAFSTNSTTSPLSITRWKHGKSMPLV